MAMRGGMTMVGDCAHRFNPGVPKRGAIGCSREALRFRKWVRNFSAIAFSAYRHDCRAATTIVAAEWVRTPTAATALRLRRVIER
jgi:hypothetical protein